MAAGGDGVVQTVALELLVCAFVVFSIFVPALRGFAAAEVGLLERRSDFGVSIVQWLGTANTVCVRR